MLEILPVGEIAALLFSLVLAIAIVYFDEAVQQIGAFNVNALRILFIALGMIAAHLVVFRSFITSASVEQWIYLSLSAIAGLVIGDFLFLTALKYSGPHMTTLVAATSAPIFTSIIGFIMLSESMDLLDIFGIVITLSGVAIVVWGRGDDGAKGIIKKSLIIGLTIALISAIGQAFGMVLAKIGIYAVEDKTSPMNFLSASVIRMIFATTIIWLFVMQSRKTRQVVKSVKKGKVFKYLLIASGFTILAAWLSLFSITYTKTGISATLQSLMPIMIIPVLYVLRKEKTSLHAVIGSVVAVLGVSILFIK